MSTSKSSTSGVKASAARAASDPAAASGFALLHRRSPLPTSFRVWHIFFCVVCLGLLLSLAMWKAFSVHNIAVSIQQERLAQATTESMREPVARLLTKLETVGNHARSIAASYKMFSGSNGRTNFTGVCEAPPANTCSPMLQRFLSNVASFPHALSFIRYVYISAASPLSMYDERGTTTSAARAVATGATNGSASNGSVSLHCGDEQALFPHLSTFSATSSAPADSTTTTTASSSSSTSMSTTDAMMPAPNVASSSAGSSLTTAIAPSTPTIGGGGSGRLVAEPQFWHECGCDLVEGCFFVDKTKTRQVFASQSGREQEFSSAQDLGGLDFILFIKNLTQQGNARGAWSVPLEYTEIYASNATNGSNVELLLQYSVPVEFDPVTKTCTTAANIDVSTEFIASVLSADDGANATFFFIDKRGPTLLGESSGIVENRVVRRKFNPLTATPASPEIYFSDKLKRLMPLFREWLGGETEDALPRNETRTQSRGYALVATPVGDHWLLLQAVGISELSFDEYRFMRHGRLYLPVIVCASFMVALLLIEFVHGTFPSADWKFDKEEEEEKRKRLLEKQRALRRKGAPKIASSTNRSFEVTRASGADGAEENHLDL